MADKPQRILIDPSSPAFDSADECAHALAATFGDASGAVNERAGGVVLGPDGRYRYTTSVAGNNDSFAYTAALPHGHKFAGIVHSHPGTDQRGAVFSPSDVQQANSLKVPSYVLFSDRSVRRYTPGLTKTRQMADPASRIPLTVADGDLVPTVAANPVPAAAGLLTQAMQTGASQPTTNGGPAP